MRLTFPGFFDLQVNGFAGIDFNTPGLAPEQIHNAAAAMRATGVTRFLPTLITSSFERFAACARALLASAEPAIAGIHMEGPYISGEEGYRGAHPAAHVQPASVDDFHRRQEAAGGRIVLVTLAPEVPGALPLIEHLVANNIRVAIGHTGATREQIQAAIAAGATMSTHLGNAVAPMLPRHHNVIWEQLGADALRASFIADGHHLPDPMLRSMLRAKTPPRSLLVTDAVAAAGAPVGRYALGELEIERTEDGRASPPGTARLAGSALTMQAAVAHVARVCGMGIQRVLPLASVQPALYLGLEPVGTVTAEWDPERFALTITNIA